MVTKNILSGVLRSKIETSNLNLVDGTLTRLPEVEGVYCPWKEVSGYNAIKDALKKIPFGKFALVFIDDTQILGNFNVVSALEK